MRCLPFDFGTTTRPEHHVVGDVTGEITPCLSMDWISFSTCGSSLVGHFSWCVQTYWLGVGAQCDMVWRLKFSKASEQPREFCSEVRRRNLLYFIHSLDEAKIDTCSFTEE